MSLSRFTTEVTNTASAIEMDHASVLCMKQKIEARRTYFLLCHATAADWCDKGRVTIDTLHDDVLLIIFDFYVAEADEDHKYEEWQKLVHVCQNWRCVVFGSPLCLNLRVLCPPGTPVRENLAL
jgi:hypothetical protein